MHPSFPLPSGDLESACDPRGFDYGADSPERVAHEHVNAAHHAVAVVAQGCQSTDRSWRDIEIFFPRPSTPDTLYEYTRFLRPNVLARMDHIFSHEEAKITTNQKKSLKQAYVRMLLDFVWSDADPQSEMHYLMEDTLLRMENHLLHYNVTVASPFAPKFDIDSNLRTRRGVEEIMFRARLHPELQDFQRQQLTDLVRDQRDRILERKARKERRALEDAESPPPAKRIRSSLVETVDQARELHVDVWVKEFDSLQVQGSGLLLHNIITHLKVLCRHAHSQGRALEPTPASLHKLVRDEMCARGKDPVPHNAIRRSLIAMPPVARACVYELFGISRLEEAKYDSFIRFFERGAANGATLGDKEQVIYAWASAVNAGQIDRAPLPTDTHVFNAMPVENSAGCLAIVCSWILRDKLHTDAFRTFAARYTPPPVSYAALLTDL